MKTHYYSSIIFVCFLLIFSFVYADESKKYLEHWESINQWESHAVNGYNFLKNEDYQKAKEEFSEAVTLGANSPKIYYQLGYCNDKLGNGVEAISNYRKAIELLSVGDENNREKYLFFSHYNLGLLLMEAGDLMQARGNFQEAIHYYPDHPKVHVALASVYILMGEKELALSEYRKVVTLDPQIAQAQYNLAILYKNTGDIEAAQKSYRKAKEIDPTLPDISFAPATRQVVKNIQDITDNNLKQLMSEADTAEDYNTIGKILLKKGRKEDAILQFRKAIVLDPDFRDSYLMLANIYRDNNNDSEAITVYEKYLQLKPNDGEILVELGKLYLEQGKMGEARNHLKNAVQVDHNNIEAHFFLAVTLEYNNSGVHYGKGFDLERVISHYNECLRINPEHTETHANLGALYLSQGKKDLAKKEFEVIMDVRSSSSFVHYNLGCIYDELALPEEAVLEFQKALEIDPYNIDTLFNFGNVLVKLRDYWSAARIYHRILEIDTDYTDAMLNLAVLYDRYLHNEAKASEYYHRYIYKNSDVTTKEKELIKKRILQLNPE